MSLDNIKPEESIGVLRKRFIEPPFSIIDARSGIWSERKNKWLELGIKSEEGRNIKLLTTQGSGKGYMPKVKSEASIFDPALCELIYKWFCPEGGGSA